MIRVANNLYPIAPAVSAAGGALTNFHPEETKKRDAVLGYAIEYAVRIKDWPALEAAVEEKIEEQAQFVVWWRENVSKRQGARTDISAERGKGVSLADAEAQTGIRNQQVSRWAKRLQDREKYRGLLYGAAYRKAMMEAATEGDNHRAQGTGENEWFTPTQHLDLARAVLGEIDLDPASNPLAQKDVRAGEFYTVEDDGLAKEWHGRVWLNPPYAQPAIGLFIDKLVAEKASGRVTEAIALTHNYTDTAWFQTAARAADMICFTRGRIRFVSPSGELAAPTQGQAFFYLGENQARFAETFANVGFLAGLHQ